MNNRMEKKPLEILSDLVTKAHTNIQADTDINPVVSVTQKMRSAGFAADVMMIDCLKSKKRILIILHDAEPESLSFQLCSMESDPGDEYSNLALDQISREWLYQLIVDYFS